MVGYGGGGVLALAAGDRGPRARTGGGDGGGGDVGPERAPRAAAAFPEQEVFDLAEGRRAAAGCELKDVKASGAATTPPIADERVKYNYEPADLRPPLRVPADDGAYSTAPTDEQLVHNLEHGRVIIWFKPSLPEDERADLKALFDEDTYQMVLVPRSEHALPGGRQRVERRSRRRAGPAGCSPATSCNDRDLRRAARVPRRAPLERPRADSLARRACDALAARSASRATARLTRVRGW